MTYFQSFTFFRLFPGKIPHDIPKIVATGGKGQLNLGKPTKIEVQNSSALISNVKVSVVGKCIFLYSQF